MKKRCRSNLVSGFALVVALVAILTASTPFVFSQSLSRAPEPPQNIVGQYTTDNGTPTVILTWEAGDSSSAIVGYNIYQNEQYLKTVHTTRYQILVVAGRHYAYRITAKDESGNRSQRSESVTVYTGEGTVPQSSSITVPAAPTNLKSDLDTNSGITSLTLSWSPSVSNNTVVSYNIYENNAYLSTVSGTSYQKTIDAAQSYAYRITAKDVNGNRSARSVVLNVADGAAQAIPELSSDHRVAPPVNLVGSVASDIAVTTVYLSWSAAPAVQSIVGYNVYKNNSYIATVYQTNHQLIVDADDISTYYVTAFDEPRNYSERSERITVPDVGNRVPIFEGLEDVTVYAGETLALVIRPVDPDGDKPQVEVGRLPTGMKFRDNGNGTRLLHWPVLEPEVGVYEVELTVTDALDPALATTRVLTVTVELPDDLSLVPNKYPAIDFISRQIVKAGDSVVMLVKGTDPNGTVPNLELLNPPVGSSFSQYLDEQAIKEFRWNTSAADLGTTKLHFRVTDASDSSLTYDSEVALDLVDDSHFYREGARLRDLADQRGIHIGYASVHGFQSMPSSGIYEKIASEEYNFVSAENSMKWAYTNPLPGQYRLKEGDNIVAFAQSHNMLVHGHTLVWYSALPQWVINTEVADRELTMYNYIDLMVSRYRDSVAVWDVVNEPLNSDGSYRNSIWYEAMGESYIAKAFLRARANDPDAVLLYNEYDISFPGPKADGTIEVLQGLINDGIPVDGIGIQMHLDTDFSDFDGMSANFARFAALGIGIYITELDVSIFDGGDEQQQADIYRNILQICLDEPACKSFQMWGFTDRYSWQGSFDPLLFDRSYQAKPAYYAIQNTLMAN